MWLPMVGTRLPLHSGLLKVVDSQELAWGVCLFAILRTYGLEISNKRQTTANETRSMGGSPATWWRKTLSFA